MNNFDVSVVIPAYRAENWISRSIQSVLDQSGVKAEVVVVEDGIYDDTRNVVEKQFQTVKLITLKKNHGAPAARNCGLAEASADFVLFLDSDDFVEGKFLKGLVERAKSDRADVVFGPWRSEGERKSDRVVHLPVHRDSVGWIEAWLSGRPRWTWSWPGRILWRSVTLREKGGWRENMVKREDDEIMVRCLLSGIRLTVSKVGTGVYWTNDSPSRKSKTSFEMLEHCEETIYSLIKHKIVSSPYELSRLQLPLGIFCYTCSRHFFVLGMDEAGDRWLRKARDIGFNGHNGTKSHRVVASLVGLRRKELIAKALRRYSKS